MGNLLNLPHLQSYLEKVVRKVGFQIDLECFSRLPMVNRFMPRRDIQRPFPITHALPNIWMAVAAIPAALVEPKILTELRGMLS
jgi:hypothetical protein